MTESNYYIEKAVELGLLEIADGKIQSFESEATHKISQVARLIDKLQPESLRTGEDTTVQEAIVLSKVLSETSSKAKENWSRFRTSMGVAHGEPLSSNIWSDPIFKQISLEVDLIYLGQRDFELLNVTTLIKSYSSLNEYAQKVSISEFNQRVTELADPSFVSQYGSRETEWNTAVDILKESRAKVLLSTLLHEVNQASRSDQKLEDIFSLIAIKSSEGMSMLRGSLGLVSESNDIVDSILGDIGGTEKNWIDLMEDSIDVGRPASTGFPCFDLGMLGGVAHFTPGFNHGGRVLCIAARAKAGKTSIGVHIATNLATQGIRTAYLSVELPRKQIEARILSSFSKKLLSPNGYHWRQTADKIGCVSSLEVLRPNPKYKSHIQTILFQIAEQLRSMPAGLEVKAPWKADAETIAQSIRMIKAKHPDLRAVILDHFHCMSASTDKRYSGKPDELEDRCYKLTTVAKEMDIDLFVLGQMNRIGLARDANNVRQEQREPQEDEFRGTDAMSHVAHCLWLIRKHSSTAQEQDVNQKQLEVWHKLLRDGQYYWRGVGENAEMISVKDSIDMSLIQLDYMTSSLRSDNTLNQINVLQS